MTVSYEQVSARLDPDISESVCLHIPEPGGLPVVVDGRDVGRVNVLVGVGALGRRGRRQVLELVWYDHGLVLVDHAELLTARVELVGALVGELVGLEGSSKLLLSA